MKKTILILPFLLIAPFLYSQVKSGVHAMSKGSHEALTIEFPNTDRKYIEEVWTDMMKQYKGKTKKNRKTGEIFSDDCQIKEMSDNTVDVYAKVIEKGDDMELQVWFDLGGAYLSPTTHADRYPAGVKILEDVTEIIAWLSMEEEIKGQEDVLKKMNGDLKHLEKEEKHQEEAIVRHEKKIEEARQKIEEAKAAQIVKRNEIETQQILIKDLKGKLNNMK